MPHLPFGLSVPEQRRLDMGRQRGRQIAERSGVGSVDLTDDRLAEFLDLEDVSRQERSARTAVRQAPSGFKAAARAPLALEQFLRGQEGATAQNIVQGGTARPRVQFGGVREGISARRDTVPSHTPAERARVGTFRTPAGQRAREQEPTLREFEGTNPFTALEDTLANRQLRGQQPRRGEFETQAAGEEIGQEERIAQITASGNVQAAREQAGGAVGAAQERGPLTRPGQVGVDPRIITGALGVLSSETASPEAMQNALEILTQFLAENAPEG